MPKEFLISDESLNSYGFKVRTSGINLDQFKRNPVGYYNHEEKDGVICRWENIRIEGQNMYATPVFDLNDPLGAKIALKVENGFINAASIGAEHPVFEEINGEKIVTFCDLREVSICDIPSNKNALAVYINNKAITGRDEILKLYANQKDMKTDLKPITNMLGLNADASVSDIVSAINTLRGSNNPETIINEAVSMNFVSKYEKEELIQLAAASPLAFGKYLEKRKQKVIQEREEAGLKLTHAAMRDGRLNGDAGGKVKAFWLHSFKDNFEGTKEALEALPKRQSVTELLGGSDTESRANWTLSDYRKKAPKELKDNPNLYAQLLEQEKEKQTK